MRILRLCSVFEPSAEAIHAVRFDPVGGMQTHTGELTRALDERGHQQVVVTTRPPGVPARARFGRYGTVVRLGLPVGFCRQCYAVPAARLVPTLAAHADLLHAHLGEDLAVVPLALAAARRHGLPLVLTVHTSVAHTLAVGDARSLLLKTLGGWLERYGERAADAVITLTPRLAARLVRAGVPAERIHVIPSGVRGALFDGVGDGAGGSVGDRDPLAGVPSPRIVFLGRLHRQKGVDVLLHAVARLAHRDARLVLVGDGPERARLEQLAHRLGLAHRVRFLGFVPHAQVPAVLNAVDALVLPSRYEELGTALLEGLYCGLPVVAACTGGIPDVVTAGVHGLLVPPGDPAALAAALDQVLGDPALRRELSARARDRARAYTWEVLVDRVLAVYEQALAGRRVPSRT